MSENKKTLKKRILDPDYKATMLSKRSRNDWLIKKAKSVGESRIHFPAYGESSDHPLTEDSPGDPSIITPSCSAIMPVEEDQEIQIMDFASQWMSVINEDEESNSNYSTEEELYFQDQDSDFEMNEVCGPNTGDEMSGVDTKAPKKVGRPTSSFIGFHDKIMFSESGLLLSDVVEMIMAFSTSFGLTVDARSHFFDMIKLCAGSEFRHLNLTNYVLDQHFEPPEDKIMYHFYCQNCEKELICTVAKKGIKGQKEKCSNCKEENLVSLSSKKFFLSVDLKYQVELMLENKDFRECIIQKIESETEPHRDYFIRDIRDGLLYRKAKELFPDSLFYIISTDGAPLHHCSKKGFWPLQIIIIDLSTKIRYKVVFLVGIMILDHEPKANLMNLFIRVFNEQAQRLHNEGIDFTVLENKVSKKYYFRLTPLLVTADAPAKAVLQNRFQYNAYDSCSYCYQRGTYVNGVKFPFLETDSEMRSHESHMSDVREVLQRGTSVRGVKGWSSFCDMVGIDMIWSFILDAMHNGILGVVVQLWDLWVKMLKPAQRKKIDDLLLFVKPPRDTKRRCGKISDRSKWKATQWKAWLFHYSIPLCTGILPIEIMEHYALFVNSMYTLSKTVISASEIDKCEEDLMKFVAQFEILYGVSSMTFNVHILLHLAENVRCSGPLWATSAFPFERNIFFIKRTVNGPKGAEQQMTKKSLQLLAYKHKDRSCLPGVVNEYIKSLFDAKKSTKSAKTVGEVTFFEECHSNETELGMRRFLKCIYKGQVFCSVKYTRSKLYNDTAIQLRNGQLAQITEICLKKDNTFHLKVQQFKVEQFCVGVNAIPHIWEVKEIGQTESLSFENIDSKIVKLGLSSQTYISKIPNVFEAQ